MLRLLSPCFLLTALLLTPGAHAQLFELAPREDLRQIDPATSNGRLGREMAAALGGRVLLVAAPFKEDAADSGAQDGSVYSFDVARDGVLSVGQVLAPPERFQFGATLDADADWAAISSSSAVYLYQYSGAQWVLRQQLDEDNDVPPTAGIVVRNLRSSLALSGDLLAVGDSSANVDAGGGPVSNAGAVVLFRRGADGVWRHEATLAAPTPSGSSAFGSSVAAHGNVLLVGAPEDQLNGLSVGAAYLYQRGSGSWSLRRTLRNPDQEEAAFGWSVAVEHDLAVVGCATCFVSPSGPSNTGSFFTFERSLDGADNWGLRGETVGSRPGFIDNFSIRLRLSAGLLLVGATGTIPNVATLFAREGNGSWRELAFFESGETVNTEFGQSLALAPARAFVGASLWPNTSSSERWGAVYSWYSPSLAACGGRLDRVFCDGFEDSRQ
jgi:hypothetical protein